MAAPKKRPVKAAAKKTAPKTTTAAKKPAAKPSTAKKTATARRPVREAPVPAAARTAAPAAKPKTVLIRQQLVTAELALAKLGIREQGGNNHGPWVGKFLASVGLPQGYPWCDAFQSYVEQQVAKRKLPIASASVGNTYAAAVKLGWVVTRPFRGDLACFDFTGDGQFDDHIGLVVKVLRWHPRAIVNRVLRPGTMILRTVEGNTSSGQAGSQADGGGVYVRTRQLAQGTVAFVRIPGTVPV